VGIAAEHDEVAGTVNGAMTLFVFTFDGLRVAHLGDLGQTALRAEQLAALGQVDVLLVPVGDGPTIGAEQAATIAAQVAARLVVPHHYRTAYIDWLEPVDAMVERFERVHRAETPVVDLDALEDGDGPLLVLPPCRSGRYPPARWRAAARRRSSWSSTDGDLRKAATPTPARRELARAGGRVKVRRETSGRRGKAVTTVAASRSTTPGSRSSPDG
jgi:hypothetical protein